MTVEDFCIAISALNLSQSQQALAILWFVDNSQPGTSRTPGELTRLLRDSGLGNSHSTRLGEAVVKSGHALRTGERLRIKPTSRAAVEKWISSVITPKLPSADQANGFIPEAIWLGTRGYVETIARQINGCYEFGFFDGAMVLLRRLVETLIIESYEHLKIESKIKKTDGNYPMLADLIVGAVGQGHLSLSRNTRTILPKIKTLGDWSAHTLRHTAVKADMDKIHLDVRCVVGELIALAGLK